MAGTSGKERITVPLRSTTSPCLTSTQCTVYTLLTLLYTTAAAVAAAAAATTTTTATTTTSSTTVEDDKISPCFH